MMAKYKLTENGVFDTERKLSIPNAPGNRHWREYQEWLAEGNTPDPMYSLDELRELKVQEVKATAGQLIKTHYPEYKQRNMLARMLELRDTKDERSLTADEQNEYLSLKSVWNWVKAVREESNRVEQEVLSSNDPENVTAAWPER